MLRASFVATGLRAAVTTLLLAAHGTRDPEGEATTRALARAVAAARPSVPVSLCFLDVLGPTLAEALDALPGPAVVVPLLLSAGYHVSADIPATVAGRARVVVAAHLGPDPLVLDALVDRLGPVAGGSVLLAAVASSHAAARAEVATAAAGLAERIGRIVDVLPLTGNLPRTLADLAPATVSCYLLAPGVFSRQLAAAAHARAVRIAPPIGVHPALVELLWRRYDRARTSGRERDVR